MAAIQVRGGLEEEIRVSVDPYKLAAQGLDPSQIARRLAQENLNASGGQIREGSTEYLVRTLNEFQTIEEIEDLAIVRRGDAAIRLRDVAMVKRTHAKREVITRLGWRRSGRDRDLPRGRREHRGRGGSREGRDLRHGRAAGIGRAVEGRRHGRRIELGGAPAALLPRLGAA